MRFKLILVLAFLLSSPLKAIQVVSSAPDIAWLAKKLLDESSKVESLTRGDEDLHRVEALPSFILATRKADFLCFLGMSLEVAWIPKVIEASANQKIQKGESGYCELGTQVAALDKPEKKLDRSMGDIHAEGNPHYYLSLIELSKTAKEMSQIFSTKLDEAQNKELELRLSTLQAQLAAQHKSLEAKLKNVFGSRKIKLMQYHANFSYFADSFSQLEMLGDIETMPGQPPAAGEITTKALQAKKEKLDLILATPYQPLAIIKKFADISGAKLIIHSDLSQLDDPTIANPLLVQESLINQIIQALENVP